jgi:Fe-S-cluster containining protein
MPLNVVYKSVRWLLIAKSEVPMMVIGDFARRTIRLDCLGANCGLCCEVFVSIITLSEREENRLVQIGAASPDARGTIVIGHHGSCCAHLRGNLCSICTDRPRSCQEYPWYSINGSFYFDMGCPGIKNGADGRPSQVC